MTNASTPSTRIGLDLGDTWSSFSRLDGAEQVEQGRVKTTTAAFSSLFARVPPARVVLEAGTHSPWVARLLRSLGHDAVVLNPNHLRLIAESTTKSDRSDAETLAFLAQFPREALRPVHHRSEQQQADLAILRARQTLVAARTELINAARGSVKVLGGRIPACDARYFHRHAAVAIPAQLRPALEPLVAEVASLSQQIAGMDQLVLEVAATRYPETGALRQVTGVGPLISLAFVLTLADPHRFKRSRDVGPYLGLTPRQRQSGQRSPQLGISRAGDSYLRQLLVQGAHYLLGWRGPDCDLRRWGLARTASGGKNAKKRALVAVARKLAVLLHHLWVTGAVYEPLRSPEGAAA